MVRALRACFRLFLPKHFGGGVENGYFALVALAYGFTALTWRFDPSESVFARSPPIIREEDPGMA